jgi:hypothetical protein
MDLILAVLSIPIIVGLYIYKRQRDGFLPRRKKDENARLSALLSGIDDCAVAIAGVPAVFSLLVGACVLVFRLFDWVKSKSPSTPSTITFQSVFEWPSRPEELATGFGGLDEIIWDLVTCPFELALIVIFPTIWFAALFLPAKIVFADFGQHAPDRDS